MFRLNTDDISRLGIYVSKPSGEIIGCLDEYIDEVSASLKVNLNAQYELQFNLNYKPDDDTSILEYLQEGMYLVVERVGLFRMKEPSTTELFNKRTITINAFSCECELEDKTTNIQINTGLSDSMEYLVEYDEDEEEVLINPYTNTPYDWIVLYNYFPEQLAVLRENFVNRYYGNQTSIEYVDIEDEQKISEFNSYLTLIPRLKEKAIINIDEQYEVKPYVSYEIREDGTIRRIVVDVNIVNRIDELIVFYTKYRNQLSLISIMFEKFGSLWSIGEIDGVADGDYSLANKKYQFEIGESAYAFFTQTYAKTANCVALFDRINRRIDIKKVENIGEETGIVLSYDTVINSINVSGTDDKFTTRIKVTGGDDLGIEQVNFGRDTVTDISYKINARTKGGARIYVTDEFANKYNRYKEFVELKRSEYIQSAKRYDELSEQISDIKYRVPNDYLKTDWSTFTREELEESLNSYQKQLATLISLFKQDYGSAALGEDGNINTILLKESIYWYDYCAYVGVITEVECAIATFPYYSNQENWSAENLEKFKDKINEWETNWSLYGTVELSAKIEAYKANMDLLSQSSIVRYSTTSYVAKTWDNLTDDEKLQYGNLEQNYFYDEYNDSYTKWLSASNYYADIKAQLDFLEATRDNELEKRTEIAKSIAEELYFTEEEYTLLQMMYRDAEYSNENIFTTSLDTRDDKYDKMLELMSDAEEYLSKYSRPQLTFTASVDNLLGLKEFVMLRQSFVVGNYLYVEYRDGAYIKLRMVSMAFNPCIIRTNNLTVTFSNFIRSNSFVSDLESLLSNSGSGGKSSGSSSSGGGSSVEVDDVLSNTLLSHLLNTETFGTRVKDVILDSIDVQKLTAKSANFGGLIEGVTKINGKCLQSGYIFDWRYNGDKETGSIDNTFGSIINLETGNFNFGGGKMVWDGESLNIKGIVTAGAGSKFGGWTLGNTSLYNGTGVGLGITDAVGAVISPLGINFSAGTADTTFYVYNNNGFHFNMGDKIKYESGLLEIDGRIVANADSKFGDFTLGTNAIYSDNRITNFSTDVAGVRLSTTGINISNGTASGTFYAHYTSNGFSLNVGDKLIFENGALTVQGSIYANSGTFGSSTPFQIGENGINGTYQTTNASDQTHNAQIDMLSSGNVLNTFTVSINRSGQSNTNRDIVWNVDDVDLVVSYSYNVTKTISSTVSDDTIIVGGGTGDDEIVEDTEQFGGGSSGQQSYQETVTMYNTIIIPVMSSTDVTNYVSVSLNSGTKTYSYSRNISSDGNAKNYILNTIRSSTSNIPSNAEINLMSVVTKVDSTYRYTSISIKSHIGTDYFNYSGLIDARGNNVTISNLIVNSNINTSGNVYLEGQGMYIRGRMASNDYWLIRGGGSNDAGYLEIATADNGNEPIYIRQYTGVYSNLVRTLTLLDGSGNTILPATLKVNSIQDVSGGQIQINSTPVVAYRLYMGSNFSQALERQIFFRVDNGTYTHECKLYGGNSDSTTGIGLYDVKNSRGILVYNDVSNVLSITGCKGFYFKDYTNTSRQPAASITGDGSRAAVFGTTSSNKLKIWGQWGKKGSTYTTRYISTSSSDKRLKTNIVDSKVDAMALIDKIKIREFDWSGSNCDKHQIIGFIADELEELDENLAVGGGYEKNGDMNVKCVDTFYLLGYAVKAIQELKAEIDKLKQK